MTESFLKSTIYYIFNAIVRMIVGNILLCLILNYYPLPVSIHHSWLEILNKKFKYLQNISLHLCLLSSLRLNNTKTLVFITLNKQIFIKFQPASYHSVMPKLCLVNQNQLIRCAPTPLCWKLTITHNIKVSEVSDIKQVQSL